MTNEEWVEDLKREMAKEGPPPWIGNAIEREWCPECGGMGHGKDCKCSGGVAFICGCCRTCGGEGMITKPPPKPKGIVLTDPDWKE